MRKVALVNYQEVKFLRASSGDWIGIYVDGKLIQEGHELSPEAALDAVGIRYEEVTTDFEHADWRHCPADYAVVEAKLGLTSEHEVEKD